jgi:hypothetical protein
LADRPSQSCPYLSAAWAGMLIISISNLQLYSNRYYIIL